MKTTKVNKINPYSYLVCMRHGQSEWNAKGLWTGWQDISLTQKGREEAQNAAIAIKDIVFHLAVTSDLKRAHETLDILKTELGLTDIPTIKDPAFKERHYGIHTGKDKWQIKKTIGDEKFHKIRRSWDEPIPEGETLKDVFARVIPGFKKHIVPAIKSGKNILLVAHGNSNRALIKYLENIPDHKIGDVEIATGEVIIYHLDSKGRVLKKEQRFADNNIGKQ